jgi:hypothetical protein
MGTRRIGLAAAAATVAACLVGGTAAATGTIVETTVTHEIKLDFVAFGPSLACGFPIQLHTVGREVTIRRYDADGTLVSQTVVQHYDGYLLNPANGKTLASRVSGPVHDSFDPDGTIIEWWSGSTARTAPGAGLVSGWIGREYMILVPTGETDEDGFPIYDLIEDTFDGQFLGNQGVCAVLA